MGRRSFAVRDIAEILEHWHAGRSIQAIARSLGVDRKTVRKYAVLAEAAGFHPNNGQGPPSGWGVWLDRSCPGLRERSRRGPTADEVAALPDRIGKAPRAAPPRPRARGPKSTTASSACGSTP